MPLRNLVRRRRWAAILQNLMERKGAGRLGESWYNSVRGVRSRLWRARPGRPWVENAR